VLITKCYTDGLNRGLWEIAYDTTILKCRGGRRSSPPRLSPRNHQNEVQYAAIALSRGGGYGLAESSCHIVRPWRRFD